MSVDIIVGGRSFLLTKDVANSIPYMRNLNIKDGPIMIDRNPYLFNLIVGWLMCKNRISITECGDEMIFYGINYREYLYPDVLASYTSEYHIRRNLIDL